VTSEVTSEVLKGGFPLDELGFPEDSSGCVYLRGDLRGCSGLS
jgi:hypothetical protein